MQAGADPEEALSTWLPSACPSAGVGPSTSTRPLPNAAPRRSAQMELFHGGAEMREQSSLLHAPAGPQTPTHNTRDGWPLGVDAGGRAKPPQGLKPRQPQGPLPPPLLHAFFQEPLPLLPGSRHTSWLQVSRMKAFGLHFPSAESSEHVPNIFITLLQVTLLLLS